MKQDKGIIITNDNVLARKFKDAGDEINLDFDTNDNVVEFFYKLINNGYRVVVFDCSELDNDNFLWVRIIRRVRPKLPLIVMSKKLDNKIGGKIFEEGIFFYQQHPVDETILGEVLSGALNKFHIQFSSK